MINEVMINRLDELIGEYNTPFFNYLLYSYDLSLNECESIIDELKEDISSSKVVSDNIVSTLDAYFKSKVADLEKREKLKYLDGLISEDNDFYIKYLKKYDLPADDISLIRERVESKIIADNITDFEIKRYLEYYFSNSLKQISYINDLNGIVGNNYDTLLIQNQKKTYPILRDKDIVDIVFAIHGEIIEAREFKNGIKNEFKRQCMIRSEDKKAKCRKNTAKERNGLKRPEISRRNQRPPRNRQVVQKPPALGFPGAGGFFVARVIGYSACSLAEVERLFL